MANKFLMSISVIQDSFIFLKNIIKPDNRIKMISLQKTIISIILKYIKSQRKIKLIGQQQAANEKRKIKLR